MIFGVLQSPLVYLSVCQSAAKSLGRLECLCEVRARMIFPLPDMREEGYYDYDCAHLPLSSSMPSISDSITLSPVSRLCLVSSRTDTKAGESLIVHTYIHTLPFTCYVV